MKDFYQLHDSRFYKVVSSAGEQLGTCPILEQAIGAGKGYAASRGEPVLVFEMVGGRRNHGIHCFPDGRIKDIPTPFVKAKKRMIAEFASEIGAFGVKATTNVWGLDFRGDEVFIEMLTEPEPVKGNKAKMQALKTAGYSLMVYVPYDWNRHRAFRVTVSRKIEVTAIDEEVVLDNDN